MGDMTSIIKPGADLAKLSERLRSAAEALRRIPEDHPTFFEETKALCEEIRAVAVLLRGDRPISDC